MATLLFLAAIAFIAFPTRAFAERIQDPIGRPRNPGDGFFDVRYRHVFAIMLYGTGFGLFQTLSNRSMFLAAPVERAASAGGLQSTARLTGQVIGALLASVLLSALTVMTASRLGFGMAGATMFVAGLISVRRMKN